LNTSTFETVAELALSLVGFSGIILAVRPRVHANRIDRTRLVDLLVAGFGVTFASFLPALLNSFLDEGAAWRLASVALGAWFAFGIVSALWRMGGRLPLPNSVGSLIGTGFAGALMVVASGRWVDHAYGVYFAALLWALCVAALEFALLLLAGQDDATV